MKISYDEYNKLKQQNLQYIFYYNTKQLNEDGGFDSVLYLNTIEIGYEYKLFLSDNGSIYIENENILNSNRKVTGKLLKQDFIKLWEKGKKLEKKMGKVVDVV